MNPTPTPNSPAPVDIARLRELLAKATPGPWSTYDAYHIGSNNIRLFHTSYYIGSIGNSDAQKVQNEIDADLIAALRNAAPALLDEIGLLRLAENYNRVAISQISAERDKLREEVERLKATNECAVKSTVEQAEQVIRLKEVRVSLRQQNEQLLKEIEELKSRPTGLWKENY